MDHISYIHECATATNGFILMKFKSDTMLPIGNFYCSICFSSNIDINKRCYPMSEKELNAFRMIKTSAAIHGYYKSNENNTKIDVYTFVDCLLEHNITNMDKEFKSFETCR